MGNNSIFTSFLSVVTILGFFFIPSTQLIRQSVAGAKMGVKSSVSDSVSNFPQRKCPNNSDPLYNRQQLLDKFEVALKKSIPEYSKYPDISRGFFVYDLSDPVNKHIMPTDCINFINNHVYHFSVVYFPFSQSHIAILEDGKVKLFKSINCKGSKDELETVISYVDNKLKNNTSKDEVLTRLKNYRRYGQYVATDEHRLACNTGERIPENADKLYPRWKTLEQFSAVLKSTMSEKIRTQYSPFFIDEARASGFFIFDLTEPSNKQTSLLERVEFKNNHVYHFAYIDLPFSFSNIAVLENGKMKFFKSINCGGKGDSLEAVINYINERMKNDATKDEVIQRIKDYRKYGVYASYNGSSTPQCEDVR